jgi:NDP-sugar pyrophosphorylase family protein
MVLAAGLGTRLRPLTNDRPKALVEIGGRTLLEIALTRLREFGIQDVVTNTHHFADLVESYLQSKNNFGMKLQLSREEILLDTGGGLKKAADFFLRNENGDEPFILHNVDVISTIDLGRMVEAHRESGALATLAVQDRKTSRYLLFNEIGQLSGRRAGLDGTVELLRPAEALQALAFCGVHVMSPRLLRLMHHEGMFSIIDMYLSLAARGVDIRAFRADEFYWRDLGKPESIEKAEREMGVRW